MVMEAFNKLLNRAQEQHLIRGVSVGRSGVSTKISHLFFANDTLIFCQLELRSLLHLRCVLLYFQAVSGLKINLNNSEMTRIGGNGAAGSFATIMGCKEVKFPLKYLSIPLGAKYKDQLSWEPVIDLFERRLFGWKINFISKEGDTPY